MTNAGMSLLDGGAALAPDVPDLGAALVRAARAGSAEGIDFIRPDGSESRMTYRELLDAASRMLAGIRAAGVAPGDTVVLQVADDPELLVAFWACVLGGHVPMPVNAGATAVQREAAPGLLQRVWNGYGKPWVITGAEQPLPREVLADPAWRTAWLGDTHRLLSHSPDGRRHRAEPGDPAMYLLTSGSTGVPKAVVLTHGNVLSRTAGTARVNRMGGANRTFNWMPLDHVGGLVMFHVRDVYLGCHQVHARIEWILEDPLRWIAAMDRHRADTTWAPNFAFGLINDQADRLKEQSWDLSRLRYIMNGGEAIRNGVVRRFLELLAPFGLPPDAMYPGWGMSETSAGVVDCRFSPGDGGDERYVPVGRPQPGTSVRVVDEHNALVPPGAIGNLQVSGAPVTAGYYRNPEQNRQSFTADGWFKSGDLAYIQDGILTVTGRADDVILLDGITYHGHEIEARVEELPFVEPSYTVACLVAGQDGETEELAVFFHPRDGMPAAEAERLIRGRVTDAFGVGVAHVVPVGREDIPKTGIGKLRRAHLRERFEAARDAGRVVAFTPRS